MNYTHLIDEAVKARQNAYAPYSKFYVGCALQLKDGTIIRGANVENCSYGLAICAERSAICAAVAQGAKPLDIIAVAVAIDSVEFAAPCGACRQVLREFTTESTPVLLHNIRDNSTRMIHMQELLPLAFTPRHLS